MIMEGMEVVSGRWKRVEVWMCGGGGAMTMTVEVTAEESVHFVARETFPRVGLYLEQATCKGQTVMT